MAKYDEFLSPKHEGRPVLVEAARRDGSGKNIENNYAKQNGSYSTMTVGMADNLTPYDESAGDDQDEPFILQATGTGNGTQPKFSTGSAALMKEKQGNTVVVNQLAKAFSTDNYYAPNGSLSVSSGVMTYTVTTAVGFFDNSIRQESQYTGNHKLWLYCVLKTSANLRCGINYNGLTIYKDCVANTKEIIVGIGQGVTTYPLQVGIETIPQVGDTLEVYEIKVIDLTQWFNGDIPQDLLDNPDHFFRYYQGSLAYNEGTLVNANGRYVKCIGRQQWDEEWEVGYINPDTGGNVDSNDTIRSKNYIPVIPGATYNFLIPWFWLHMYDENKNFIGAKQTNGASTGLPGINDDGNCYSIQYTLPQNCRYIRIRLSTAYGTTYNHDITISLYYEDETGYDQYYPYEVLTNNDTGTETLLAYDYKEPNGTIHRNTAEYTFTGSESWTQYGTSWVCTKAVTKGAPNLSVYHKSNLSFNIQWASAQADQFEFVNPGWSTQAEAQAATNGKKIQYKVAEPTTEQGTTFSENLVIDDFGSMDFAGNNGVPQGNLIFYPVDYKAFIDTLYKYTNGAPSKIALKSDLASDKSELQGADSALQAAVGGTLRQCLCVKESLDFDNTAYLDLGSLTFAWSDSEQLFLVATPSDFINWGGHDADPYPGLCTKYKMVGRDHIVDKSISVKDVIRIKDASAGTDNTSFKNSLKGVLLAYEKAQ